MSPVGAPVGATSQKGGINVGVKAAQRQANYRQYNERFMSNMRNAAQGKTPEEARAYEEYLAEFQERLDLMFVQVPQIADNWNTFVVAANEISYRMIADSPSLSEDEKKQYAAEHRTYLRQAQKNWPRIMVAVIALIAILVIIVWLVFLH